MPNQAPIVVVKRCLQDFQSSQPDTRLYTRSKTSPITLKRGEVLVVIGPSGSGKSTFLRALNGLQPIDSGSIVIDGVELTAPKTDLNRLRQKESAWSSSTLTCSSIKRRWRTSPCRKWLCSNARGMKPKRVGRAVTRPSRHRRKGG